MTRPRGFSLLELLVVMAILAIVAATATPSLRVALANARIKTLAESWRSGLDLARAAAIRLNTRVEFVITPSGWKVNRVDSTSVVLHQATGREGAEQVTLTVTPEGADRLTFDAFGRALAENPNSDGDPVQSVEVTVPHSTGLAGLRPLRIQLVGAGVARLCDPAKPEGNVGACT